MSLAVELRVLCQKLADDAQGRVARMKAELAELEERKVKIQSDLTLTGHAFQRALNFQPQIDGKLQCPRCWVDNELRTALTPIPSDAGDDMFRCRACHFEHRF